MKSLLNKITKQQNIVVVLGYILVASALVIRWNDLNMLQKLGHFLFLILCMHQLEEYCYPGGFLIGFNTMVASNNLYSWPGNRLSAGVCNIAAQCIGVYLTLFRLTPQVICGFALFGLMEVVQHTASGFKVKAYFASKGKKNIYNPGAITSWFAFLPVSVGTLYHVLSAGAVAASDWKWIVGCIFAFAFSFIGLPTLLLKDSKEEYVYNVCSGYFGKYLEGENQ